jgi:hypothetical protein
LETSFGGEASEASGLFDFHGCSESESLAGEYTEFVKQNGGTTNATPSSTLRLGLASDNIWTFLCCEILALQSKRHVIDPQLKM